MGKFRDYIITPPHPYSDVSLLRRVLPVFTNELRFIARFDETVKYTCVDTKNQSSWMKLTGLKEVTQKDNSARPGFRWLDGELQFCLYVHYNGENLGALDPPVVYSTRNVKEEIHGAITADGDLYRLYLNGHQAVEKRGGGWLMKWMMHPYAQIRFLPGHEHSINIKMKIL